MSGAAKKKLGRDVVSAIVGGNLPLDWTEQARVLGFFNA